MKNIKFLFALLAITFVSFSCDEDDTEEVPGDGTITIGVGNGSLVIDGNSSTIAGGIVINYGLFNSDPNNPLYNFDIELISDDYVISGENISGQGENVYFELLTDDANGLKNGTYTLNQTAGDFTFIDSDVNLEYDFNTGSGTEIDIVSGTLEVTRNGNNYDLSWNISGDGGQSITGTYNGTLTLFNDDNDDNDNDDNDDDSDD
ncbi:MAG: hypothetical protein AAF688_02280 [Bacteroidota bacterium]